jgi:hypothetical protein
MSKRRFKVIHKERNVKIFLDTDTGATYLFTNDGYAGGLTPLLGSDGNPLVLNPEEFGKKKTTKEIALEKVFEDEKKD